MKGRKEKEKKEKKKFTSLEVFQACA